MRTLASLTAITFLIIIALMPLKPLADSSIQVITWGTLPAVKFSSEVDLGPNDGLRPGDYWRAVYEIKVLKWWYESEDVVKQRVLEHLQKILGEIKIKHPEIWLMYAKYTLEKTEGYSCLGKYCLGTYYYYKAEIIGKIMEPKLENGKVRMVAPVVAAIVIAALIAAAVWGAVVLTQQPAVQKLLVASSHAIESAAKSGFAIPVAVVAAGLGVMFMGLAVAIIALRRRGA